MVSSVARFVAERPEDDAWTVEISHDHLPSSVEICFLPLGVVGRKFGAVGSDYKKPMALKVTGMCQQK
jgi:hypothetical protein